jgi:glycosyltransferase involved in cell wall biosynthesis
MHFLIVADAFLPMRTSAAVMLADLAKEFVGQSHQVSMIIPAQDQSKAVSIKMHQGIKVYSVRAFKTKDISYIQRTLAELINPFVIWNRLRSYAEFQECQADAIIWYSPSIFWGPLIKRLKAFFKCKSYLILRDIFPDWALDLGLLKRDLVYFLFKKVAEYQYRQADFIGLQSPESLTYFLAANPSLRKKSEVLWNWVGPQPQNFSSIQIKNTQLEGKKVGVYAGNIGVAQGIEHFHNIARIVAEKPEYGLIFVGRGREMQSLKTLAIKEGLDRILFFDEIDPSEIASLYAQCHFGLLVLDPRHKTHNIPGKFISYVHSQIPTFGLVNKGNDLHQLIKEYSIGILSSDYSIEGIRKSFALFDKKISNAQDRSSDYKMLEDKYFSSTRACSRIFCALQPHK